MSGDIKLILGTMNFGPQVDSEESLLMIKRFFESKNNELDTAFVYNNGDTELILGEVLSEIPDNSFSMATKVHPRITGKLDGDAVVSQFTKSLSRMKLNSIDLLYLHFPDMNTPVEGALEVCNHLYNQGLIKELGLSNFPAWSVVDIWHICKERGWLLPTVYQGMYNGLCRNVESELFPALRKFGIRFYAFNPLAGGILSGKHKNFDAPPLEGRFSRLQSYRNRYWKKSYFDAVNILIAECNKTNISLAEAAYRWLANHSLLNSHESDGIIIGASSISQLEQNLLAVQLGPLPSEVINAFNIAWDEAKTESPSYFSFYNSNKV